MKTRRGVEVLRKAGRDGIGSNRRGKTGCLKFGVHLELDFVHVPSASSLREAIGQELVTAAEEYDQSILSNYKQQWSHYERC